MCACRGWCWHRVLFSLWYRVMFMAAAAARRYAAARLLLAGLSWRFRGGGISAAGCCREHFIKPARRWRKPAERACSWRAVAHCRLRRVRADGRQSGVERRYRAYRAATCRARATAAAPLFFIIASLLAFCGTGLRLLAIFAGLRRARSIALGAAQLRQQDNE